MEGVLNNGSVSQQQIVYEVEQAQGGDGEMEISTCTWEPSHASELNSESTAYRIACLQQARAGDTYHSSASILSVFLLFIWLAMQHQQAARMHCMLKLSVMYIYIAALLVVSSCQ
jgi:hypothetical protein